MAEFSNEVLKSFRATETIPAFVVVSAAATNAAAEAERWDTVTGAILGISKTYAETGGAVVVVIAGAARCLAVASISAGALLTPDTTAAGSFGYASETTQNVALAAASLTNNVIAPLLGIALSNATASGTVQVLLQPHTRRIRFT